MINLHIKNLLDLIQKESSSLPGVYERRLPAVTVIPVYVGVDIPSNLYRFSFLFNNDFDGLLSDDGTEGFSISVTADSAQSDLSKFSINLLHTKYSEIFLILCSDLLNVLNSRTNDERSTLINLNKRLDYWRQFLKRSRIEKLSPEAEIGLIGELLLLRTLLEKDRGFDLMNHWKGPMGSSHDLVSGDVALEVKTSTVKQKRFIKISSEFQLDLGMSQKLFLAHIEINESNKSLQSFNLISLIEDIKNLIETEAQVLFNGLLACVGYRGADAHFYEKKYFSLVEKTFYRVIDEFPRLTNESLSPNISDIQYKLNLTGLESYKADEQELLDIFLGN